MPRATATAIANRRMSFSSGSDHGAGPSRRITVDSIESIRSRC
jgi:hypothetical protein